MCSRRLGPGSGRQQADGGGSQGGACTAWRWWQGCHHPRVCAETKHLGVQVLVPPNDAFRGATGISGTRCYFKPPARSGLRRERRGFGVAGFLCGPAFSFVPLTAVRTSPTYAGSTKARPPEPASPEAAVLGVPRGASLLHPEPDACPARSGVASAGNRPWAGSARRAACILAHLSRGWDAAAPRPPSLGTGPSRRLPTRHQTGFLAKLNLLTPNPAAPAHPHPAPLGSTPTTSPDPVPPLGLRGERTQTPHTGHPLPGGKQGSGPTA